MAKAKKRKAVIKRKKTKILKSAKRTQPSRKASARRGKVLVAKKSKKAIRKKITARKPAKKIQKKIVVKKKNPTKARKRILTGPSQSRRRRVWSGKIICMLQSERKHLHIYQRKIIKF